MPLQATERGVTAESEAGRTSVAKDSTWNRPSAASTMAPNSRSSTPPPPLPSRGAAAGKFPGELPEARAALAAALRAAGGAVREEGDRYVYATFGDSGGGAAVDDVEFLFSDPSADATVNLRASSRGPGRSDGGRNARRLEELRAALGWEQVPVLRNRTRRLFFIESPWDTFGPEPPLGGVDYSSEELAAAQGD
eukprot:SM000083S22746  [mRNA]  locus=s83:186109:190246:- [translate_table: standard]